MAPPVPGSEPLLCRQAAGLETPRIPHAVAEQAVQWWMELKSQTPNARRLAEWERWKAATPENAQAWQRIEGMGNQMAQVPMPLARAALAAAPASPQRRRTVQLLTLLVMGGAGAALVGRSTPWQAAVADVASGRGDIRTVRLPDGGVLVLNTDSAANIRFDGERRVVHLVRGEVLVQTAHDATRRPFYVQTTMGTVRAIGTRFTVRLRDDAVEVGVLQGAVELTPHKGADGARTLQAGEWARFTPREVGAMAPLPEGEGAWADGMLVVSGMRLDRFLAELGRYRRGRLGCDSSIAHLSVSGTYPLDDTDRILLSLTSALPIEVHRFTRYWVTVQPARVDAEK